MTVRFRLAKVLVLFGSTTVECWDSMISVLGLKLLPSDVGSMFPLVDTTNVSQPLFLASSATLASVVSLVVNIIDFTLRYLEHFKSLGGNTVKEIS